MPPIKVNTPQPLEDLCLTAVIQCLETDLVLCEVATGLAPSSLLLRRIDLSMNQIARQLSEYMSFLPGTLSEMVRQKITTRVIKKYTNAINDKSQETVPFNSLPLHVMTVRLLEIILNEDVHTFDLSELKAPFDHDPLKRVNGQPIGSPELWEVVLNRCTGLKKFCFPPLLSSSFGVNLNSFIISLTLQCDQLTELILKDAVQDRKVLSAVGAHCPALRVIDLTGSAIVCTDILYLLFPALTETELAANCNQKSKRSTLLPDFPCGMIQSRLCIKLRELILSETKVRSLGVYYALKYLPNLESLGTCHHVLSGIKKNWLQGLRSFNFKHAHVRGSTKEKINLLCCACPNLESLSISSGCNHPFTFKLHNLNKVPHLRSLTLASASCVDLTGLNYISQLAELKLQIPDVDIGQIAEACPMLEKFVLMNEPKKVFKLTESHSKSQPIFQHLREIQVNCPITANVAELLITQAPLIKTVKLVRIKKLTDQTLARWLDKNPLLVLETWLLTYAHLTVDSVTLLLNRCPNLSTLGRLAGWDIRSWESRRLLRNWGDYKVKFVLFSLKQDVPKIMDATASSDEEQI